MGWYACGTWRRAIPAQIDAYLKQFDVYDRYDFDGDGNFNEPDGYIDMFQSVHAGLGEEEGGAPETIWSHSWYAHYEGWAKTGAWVQQACGIQIETRACGSATTPSSPRTAAWACSPTSTAMTSACRTCTTTTARTGPASDAHVVRLLARHRQGHHREQAQLHPACLESSACG